jgi:hypothetical protein
MNATEKEQYWYEVFQRGFANTNITLTKVNFLDLIPNELKKNTQQETGDTQ